MWVGMQSMRRALALQRATGTLRLRTSCWPPVRRAVASYAEQAAQQAAQERAAERAATATPLKHTAAAGVGVLITGWYCGWFDQELPKSEQFSRWLTERGIAVVVFGLDRTMSAADGGDGEGVQRHELEDYFDHVSEDFVVAARLLAKKGVHLAVATCGERDRDEGLRRSSWLAWRRGGVAKAHQPPPLLGVELARAVVAHRCPEARHAFGIMVEYSPALRHAAPEESGKRHHMRQIAEHYEVPFEKILLIDAAPESLRNEDGWKGVLVKDTRVGFQFSDCLETE